MTVLVMPKNSNPDQPFDQMKYIQDWKKQNMANVGASYKKDFVEEFKEACHTLGVKQSDGFRKAMEEIIEKAKTKE